VSEHRQPLRRARRPEAWLGGVCAGLARWLGWPRWVVRLTTVLLAGITIPLYIIALLLIPREGSERSAAHVAILGTDRRKAFWWGFLIAFVATALAVGAGPVSPEYAGAVFLVAVGALILWRQWAIEPERFGRPDRARLWMGIALLVTAVVVFTISEDAEAGVIASLALLLGAAMAFAPKLWRLRAQLDAERRARVRSEERAEIAAHLHDSVLQTLSLIQRHADDPQEIVALTRRQERDLRSYLFGGAAPSPSESLAAAIAAAAAEVEDGYRVRVEVVTVGDRPLDQDGVALVAAAREAMTNAAKFSGAEEVSVFVEAGEATASVFVRDRGAGFDPAAVPPDRRGVAESIVGRMERHRGSATVRSAPGEGTEVALTLGTPPATNGDEPG
jgi:signal transduction histidine kinase